MGFEQGLSGLNAASSDLDVIGNNIANANTVGFKQSNAEFADVYASALAGSSNIVGIGTTVSAVAQQFTQGNIETSSNPLDLAINGNGFFVLDNNGTTEYSRNGQLQLNSNGYLVNAQGAEVTGYGVDAAGTVVTASPAPIQVSNADLTPNATSTAAINVNVDATDTPPADATFNISDPNSYNNSTSLTTYDSLGNSHTLTMYFVNTAANTWSVYGASDGTQIGTTPLGTLAFQTNGAIDPTKTTLPFNVSVPLTNGATTPLTYSLDFSGSTQFGSAFATNQVTQNGFTSGQLSGFTVGAAGTVTGNYSNGQTRNMGQIVLANFANPQGLQPLGNNAWSANSASGQPVVGAPQSGSLGAIQAGAVEDSNIDLTAQLVDLITAQRVYQANAQTIKTQDAVLQTLVTLQ